MESTFLNFAISADEHAAISRIKAEGFFRLRLANPAAQLLSSCLPALLAAGVLFG
jgi:hypothetical protein